MLHIGSISVFEKSEKTTQAKLKWLNIQLAFHLSIHKITPLLWKRPILKP